MASQSSSSGPRKSDRNREDRLKSALKANMARRKAQARARAGQGDARTAVKTGASKGSEQES
ncbi:hypothetical protein [Sulfitobacter sp. JB4-11]|uniref:hypothetical protein n=1 Tax=Sulfitobacter rhodophyticola TaxID=3238304 RepID=UPI003514D8C5